MLRNGGPLGLSDLGLYLFSAFGKKGVPSKFPYNGFEIDRTKVKYAPCDGQSPCDHSFDLSEHGCLNKMPLLPIILVLALLRSFFLFLLK